MRAHADVLIILKDSLKWIPIVGWVIATSAHCAFGPN